MLSLALLAYLVMVGANALGVPWLGIGVASCLFLTYAVFVVLQMRKRAGLVRESRWEQGIYEAEKRARAIVEVRQALGRLNRERVSHRKAFARLSVLLAELLDADGDWNAARSVIAGVPLSGLPPLDTGLVRHTQAVIHLRAGDAQTAHSVLSGRDETGDSELDQRLSLLEAYAQIERGEVRPGLTRAEAISHLHDIDESVRTEARVVRAAGLDALGRREEAMVVLAALGREALEPLSQLGQPRVRTLAREILEGLSEG